MRRLAATGIKGSLRLRYCKGGNETHSILMCSFINPSQLKSLMQVGKVHLLVDQETGESSLSSNHSVVGLVSYIQKYTIPLLPAASPPLPEFIEMLQTIAG